MVLVCTMLGRVASRGSRPSLLSLGDYTVNMSSELKLDFPGLCHRTNSASLKKKKKNYLAQTSLVIFAFEKNISSPPQAVTYFSVVSDSV